MQVDALCKSKMDSWSIPNIYKIRNSFPLTPNGKRDVRAMEEDRSEFYLIDEGCVKSFDF